MESLVKKWKGRVNYIAQMEGKGDFSCEDRGILGKKNEKKKSEMYITNERKGGHRGKKWKDGGILGEIMEGQDAMDFTNGRKA